MNKQNRFIDTENKLMVVTGGGVFGELGIKGEGIKNFRLVVAK